MLAAAMVAALSAVALGGVSVGAAVTARHRAQAAADLAALAAARTLPAGPNAACAQAAAVARAMHATVSDCRAERLDVVISVHTPTGLRFAGPARASARAGRTGR